MIIRHTALGDAPAMGNVMVETWLSTHKSHIPKEAWQKRLQEWTPAVSARGWARALREIDEAIKAGTKPDTCLYVAVDENCTDNNGIVGLAIGYAGDVDELAVVGSIYICQSHQGQGLGRQLIKAVATYMADAGFSSLQIGVLASNRAARQFYEAIGGKIVVERDFDEEGTLLPEVVYGWPDIQTLVKEETQ